MKRQAKFVCGILGGVAACLALTLTPASAASPAYTGTWAADLSTCKIAQDHPDAPMIVTSKGYDQNEAHCSFKKVEETGPNEWTVSGSCSVQGDEQPLNDKLTVSGDTLSIGEPGASQDLLRCP
jgi:hypothetical protein